MLLLVVVVVVILPMMFQLLVLMDHLVVLVEAVVETKPLAPRDLVVLALLVKVITVAVGFLFFLVVKFHLEEAEVALEGQVKLLLRLSMAGEEELEAIHFLHGQLQLPQANQATTQVVVVELNLD